MFGAIREFLVTASPFLRLAVLGVVALSIAGCGRKGALDPPPGVTQQQQVGVPQMESRRSSSNVAPIPGTAVNPGEFGPPRQQPAQSAEPTEDEHGNPIVSQGRKKPFLLDPILN